MSEDARSAADTAWSRSEAAPVAELAGCRFRLIPFDQIALDRGRNYLIKGLLPREGLAVIWGPPKCGKSFLVLDALLHVALGWEYRGRRVQQGPVVYLCLEGERGFSARVEAFRQDRGVRDVPFYVVPTKLDLAADADQLVDDIRRQIGGAQPVAVCVDTLNRSLRGSESSDEDMAAYVRGADTIRAAFGCVVPIVHHCGHDDSRMRGHSSLLGALDVELQVKRDAAGRVVATVGANKDGASGDSWASTLRVVEVGLDVDGEPIATCVVDEMAEPTTTSSPVRLTAEETGWLRDLQRLMEEPEIAERRVSPTSSMLPVAAATRVEVRDWYRRVGRVGAADAAPAEVPAAAPLHLPAAGPLQGAARSDGLSSSDRATLSRYLNRLKDKGKIGIHGNWIWVVR